MSGGFLIPLGVYYVIDSSVGIIGNLVLVQCSLRNKNIRGPFHILVCLTSTSYILHLFGSLIYSFQIFGNVQTSQSTCFFMMSVPLIGVTASSPLVLALGIDRLIGVKFPIKYRSLRQEPRTYLLLQLVFPALYSTSLVLAGFFSRTADRQVPCSVSFALNGASFRLLVYGSVPIYVVLFLVYAFVYYLLKTSTASARFKSAFKSIAVTVVFVLFGWLASSLLSILNQSFVSDPTLRNVIQMYAGIPVTFAATCNSFVFYAINSDYRSTIKLILFEKRNHTSSAVSSVVKTF